MIPRVRDMSARQVLAIFIQLREAGVIALDPVPDRIQKSPTREHEERVTHIIQLTKGIPARAIEVWTLIVQEWSRHELEIGGMWTPVELNSVEIANRMTERNPGWPIGKREVEKLRRDALSIVEENKLRWLENEHGIGGRRG